MKNLSIRYFSDISVAVVSLLQELTDTETLAESEEDVDVLIDALVSYTNT